MKICFIADARSPIARGWIDLFRGRHEIVVLSNFPVDSPWEGVRVINLEWMNWIFKPGENNKIEKSKGRRVLRFLYDVGLQPIRARALAIQIRRLVRDLRPDIVHALRIAIESQAAMLAGCRPLAVSIWGEADFELHAKRSVVNRHLTRLTFSNADAVFADCEVDFARAGEFGLKESRVRAILPGGGGITLRESAGTTKGKEVRARFNIQEFAPLVITPRGARYYVRNDTFLKAVSLVHRQNPSVVFLGIGLKGWAPAEDYVVANGLTDTLKLIPYIEQVQLFELMSTADVSISLSEHDGTPNTLLEAMSSGAFPICGDLPSIREWISPGKNGYLVDPSDAQQVASSILDALANKTLRTAAAAINRELVSARADRSKTREQAEALYRTLAGEGRGMEQRSGAGSF